MAVEAQSAGDQPTTEIHQGEVTPPKKNGHGGRRANTGGYRPNSGRRLGSVNKQKVEYELARMEEEKRLKKDPWGRPYLAVHPLFVMSEFVRFHLRMHEREMEIAEKIEKEVEELKLVDDIENEHYERSWRIDEAERHFDSARTYLEQAFMGAEKMAPYYAARLNTTKLNGGTNPDGTDKPFEMRITFVKSNGQEIAQPAKASTPEQVTTEPAST